MRFAILPKMNISFFPALLLILAGSLRLAANPAVIAELAKFDTIFTGVYIEVEGKQVCMVDRVLKGNVNPAVMAYVKTFTDNRLPKGTRCLFITKEPPGNKFKVYFVNDKMITYTIDGHLKYVKLKDIIDALDATPKIKPDFKPR